MTKMDFELSGIVAELNTRAYRHQLLSSNIANADTPGYHAKDLDFNKALTQAIQHRNTDFKQFEQYRTPANQALDANTVDLNMERTEMMQNSVMYEFSLQRANHYFKMLELAIKGN